VHDVDGEGPAPIEPTDRFPAIGPMGEVRGAGHGGTDGAGAPGASGAELAAVIEAAPDLKAAIVASGRPTGVATGDLVSFPYPTSFGLWRAARSPAPLLRLTARMLVVQWEEPVDRRTRSGRRTPAGATRRRTLLWGAGDHERAASTPLAVRLRARSPLPDRMAVTTHGTVLGHVQALGIDPLDVDYVAFDHLQVRDVRRMLGTTRPAPDLDAPEAPLRGWFPNATLLTSAQEWATLRRLHPMQAPWYEPATFRDLDPARVALVTGDVQLGPGVALLSTPGHTAGSCSLALHTDEGVWVSSTNAIAAECYAPRASRIPGLRRFAEEWGQEVVLHGNTPEFAARHYDSMVLERELADPTPDAPFPRCFPVAELTASRFAPGLAPTFVHGAISAGVVRGTLAPGRGAAA
jgi:hypothetical protein